MSNLMPEKVYEQKGAISSQRYTLVIYEPATIVTHTLNLADLQSKQNFLSVQKYQESYKYSKQCICSSFYYFNIYNVDTSNFCKIQLYK